jgi:hypothetical protein
MAEAKTEEERKALEGQKYYIGAMASSSSKKR